MLPQLPRLRDYDISARHGFLPAEIPLDYLSDSYYAPWETVIKNLQSLILTRRLRGVVDRLHILTTDFLVSEPQWRRAHTVLAVIAHAYMWGGDSPSDRIPPCISVPFLETCHHLELPAVATYSALVLWNWRPVFLEDPIDLDNLSTLVTYTGSLDESWFYTVSVAIEAKAAPIIPIMLDAIDAARRNDSPLVTECLRTFAERLDEIGGLFQRMYDNCDPHVFYHRIRPFLAGSKNMADAGLPNGVIWDIGDGAQNYTQYSGASNAQSSIIQFFDIVLGIEHLPTGERASDHSSSESEGTAPPPPAHSFIKDMRRYMPGPHRRFLEHVERVANIRDYVLAHQSDRALTTAYDACLAMLRALRDKHIQIVTRYIILKSRETRSSSRSLSPQAAKAQRMNLATGSMDPYSIKKNLKGTGGTALIPFLKQARDETGEPAIDAWARRLLNNGPGAAEMNAYEAVQTKTGLIAAPMTKVAEHASGDIEMVGLAGTWSVDDSEGGICHW